MSWRGAPVYVVAHDLATWIVLRTETWPNTVGRQLAERAIAEALDLVQALAIALTFPDARCTSQQVADQAIVRLRETLRLAAAAGLLSRRQLRHATARLAEVGRMLGGWRKRTARARSPPPP